MYAPGHAKAISTYKYLPTSLPTLHLCIYFYPTRLAETITDICETISGQNTTQPFCFHFLSLIFVKEQKKEQKGNKLYPLSSILYPPRFH